MADFRNMVKKTIGGSKYPDKKRINLYQREIKKRMIALQLVAILLLAGVLQLVARYGVVEPLKHAERAEMIYHRMEKQLMTIRKSNRVLESVTAEYAHYGNGYQTAEERQRPDRIQMLHTLEETIFPYCAYVGSVSVTDDYMNVACVLSHGSDFSELIRQIESDEAVRYVTASVETVIDEQELSNELAIKKEVDVSLTVYFKKSGESENKS